MTHVDLKAVWIVKIWVLCSDEAFHVLAEGWNYSANDASTLFNGIAKFVHAYVNKR